jgi:hypothetical protein
MSVIPLKQLDMSFKLKNSTGSTGTGSSSNIDSVDVNAEATDLLQVGVPIPPSVSSVTSHQSPGHLQ